MWDFDFATSDYITHHDAELLPNGNIMAMTWHRVPLEDANAIGSKFNKEIFTEGLIEIDPVTQEIVWQWNSLDHLVQDFDATKANFGDIAENPQLIDINFVDFSVEAVMHSNGFAYDEENDLIYMSVNNIGEVWVLDHSTSKEEAASHTGGNFNKGGDLVYRFGNPEASKSLGDRWFFKNNHHPYLLDTQTMLIFSNGDLIDESTVLELTLPEELAMQQTPTVPPVISWSFMDPELNAGKASGAVRLPNGNTLITENDFGVWEVTQNKEVVWKYTQPGFIWRSYGYNKDDAGILALELD